FSRTAVFSAILGSEIKGVKIMQFPKNIFNNRMLFNMLIMTFLVAGSMTAAFGQRTISEQKSELAVGYTINQCANGKRGTPKIPCTDAQFQNGNLNSNDSQYIEGEAVPYRTNITGLTGGETYSITIAFDTTKGGKHALD